MRRVLKERLVGFVDCFFEDEEEMRLQEVWSFDNWDSGGVFVGYCIEFYIRIIIWGVVYIYYCDKFVFWGGMEII